MAPEVNMSGKTVVLTGPTKGGIGYATAETLAKFGARLVLGARNMISAESSVQSILDAVPGADVEAVQCDLNDLGSVEKFAAAVSGRVTDGVDVLICNAGMTTDTLKKNSDGVELTFAACALGHHKMIHAMSPRRVVWVTGDIYALSQGVPDPRLNQGGHEAYHRACLARLLLAAELKRRSAEVGGPAEIVCVHPGVIASDFAKLGSIGKRVANWLLISPLQGAQSSILAATAASDIIHQEDAVPYYHNKHGWLQLSPDDKAMDSATGRALFDECDEICKIEARRTP